MGVGCLPPDDSIPASSGVLLVTLHRFGRHLPISRSFNSPKKRAKREQKKKKKKCFFFFFQIKSPASIGCLWCIAAIANAELEDFDWKIFASGRRCWRRRRRRRPLQQWERHQPLWTCVSTAKIDWIYLNDVLNH